MGDQNESKSDVARTKEGLPVSHLDVEALNGLVDQYYRLEKND
jgi:hypothetical protein